MERTRIKQMAREQIKGNILMYFLVSLVVGALVAASGVVGIGPILVTPIFDLGLILVEMSIREGRGVNVGDIFTPFNDFPRVWCTYFLSGLFTFLWSLLFVIPGIVKSFSYALAPYIIAEEDGITASEAIKKSMAMMKGHKGELFVLYLSFIGWYLLSILTFGILFIYVEPYIKLSVLNFYNEIKNENIEEPVIL